MPSRTARPATRRATAGSSHQRPNRVLASRPTRTAAARYAQSIADRAAPAGGEADGEADPRLAAEVIVGPLMRPGPVRGPAGGRAYADGLVDLVLAGLLPRRGRARRDAAGRKIPNGVGSERCYAGAMQLCHAQVRFMRLRRA